MPTEQPYPAAEVREFSTRIFIPNRVGEGALFTVQALNQDMSNAALSTYTGTETLGRIQVYSRPGLYAGHTSGDDGWTLVFDGDVHQRGLAEPTRLGPFANGQRVDVAAGESASFYVYNKQHLTYQFSDEWTEGDAVIDDGYLRLYAGMALAYGKWEGGCEPGVSPQRNGQCAFSPRVFSGALEYSLTSADGGEFRHFCFFCFHAAVSRFDHLSHLRCLPI